MEELRIVLDYVLRAHVLSKSEILRLLVRQSALRVASALLLVTFVAIALRCSGGAIGRQWYGLALDMYAALLVVWVPIRSDIYHYAETFGQPGDPSMSPHEREMRHLLLDILDYAWGLLLFVVGFAWYFLAVVRV